jgi:hypothetical protein
MSCHINIGEQRERDAIRSLQLKAALVAPLRHFARRLRTLSDWNEQSALSQCRISRDALLGSHAIKLFG